MFIRKEVLCHLHCQIVQREDALQKRQYLSITHGHTPIRTTFHPRTSTCFLIYKINHTALQNCVYRLKEKEHAQAPQRQTSSCLEPVGCGRHILQMTRKTPDAPCPTVHPPTTHTQTCIHKDAYTYIHKRMLNNRISFIFTVHHQVEVWTPLFIMSNFLCT